MSEKRCNICSELKALSEFYVKKYSDCGKVYMQTHCKVCQRDLAASYRRGDRSINRASQEETVPKHLRQRDPIRMEPLYV